MAITDYFLTELAYLTVQATVLPFMITLWCRNRAHTGWAFATAVCLWWQVSIRDGLSLNNPLSLFIIPQELSDADFIFRFLFTTLTIICAMCGEAVGYLLDLPFLLPLEALMPISPGKTINSAATYNQANMPGWQDEAVGRYGLCAWGYNYIPRPYLHFLFTLILFVFSVPLAFILFEHILPLSNWGALLAFNLAPIVGCFVAFLVWRYWTSLYVFGPNERNLDERENQVIQTRKSDEMVEMMDADLNDQTRPLVIAQTNNYIMRTAILLAFFQIFLSLIIGGVTAFTNPANINVIWILAIVLVLFLTIVIILVVIIYYRIILSRDSNGQYSIACSSMQGTVNRTNKLDSNKSMAKPNTVSFR
jgi:hypothetical protein